MVSRAYFDGFVMYFINHIFKILFTLKHDLNSCICFLQEKKVEKN